MKNQTYETSFEREINSPLENVWSAWSDQTKWSSWVSMKMTTDFRVGGRYNNGNGEGGRYLEIIPHKIIQFTWEMKRYKPGSIIEVSFYNNKADTTICKLSHKNLQSISDKSDSELGWNWAMDSLKSFIENGKALSWEEWETLNN